MAPKTEQIVDFRVRAVANSAADDEGRVTIEGETAPYLRVYGDGISVDATFPTLTREMADHNIVGVVQAEYEEGTSRSANMAAAQMLVERPDLFVGGIATVDPRAPDALVELQWAHEELGLRGLVFQPGFLQIHPTDNRCFPLYEYLQDRGEPVTIHTGVNFSRTGPIEYGRPIYVDQVACAFPDLTLVCNHGGWPWVMETAAILWKHDNVYADFGAVAPKYMVGPKGGWEPIAHWMNSQIANKVLLGTDWPMLRYARLRAELPLLGLSPSSYEAYTRGNATRIIEQVWGDSLISSGTTDRPESPAV
jgi:hypothetical protein